MKRLVWALAFICGTAVFGACSVDTNDDSYATVSYYGRCDSVIFSDINDTVYEKYITKVLASKNIPLTGDSSLFQEKGKTDDSSISSAITACNMQAIQTYSDMLVTATSSLVRSTLYSQYGDIINIDSLNNFTVYLSLYGYYNNADQWVANYSKTF